ncbi:hypothetical protein JQ633_24975 [Bradyrhizobium tropiciagri]|uniref:hypothetical protein n=1 Tax=Bradyrhizobium tropiciagri TaxID=312253 RepID=UPI001BA67636|nr:hypothetical protein [Bradyrhizobium tropiciagri]MBR0873633.1 hypothetical protein [Bradyrhizobium tropiciagri]
MAESKPVLIAGGGIGGLAVALGLAQKGGIEGVGAAANSVVVPDKRSAIRDP